MDPSNEFLEYVEPKQLIFFEDFNGTCFIYAYTCENNKPRLFIILKTEDTGGFV